MTLRKQEDTWNWKLEHYIAVCVELPLEGAIEPCRMTYYEVIEFKYV